jgi:hypothetical protein
MPERCDSDSCTRAGSEFDQLCVDAPRLAYYPDHHLPFYKRLKTCSLTLDLHGG